MKTIVLFAVLTSTLCFAEGAVEKPAADAPRLLKNGYYKFRGTVPDGFRRVSKPRGELIGAGAGTFAAGYLASVLLTTLWARDAAGLVPVFGTLISFFAHWSDYSLTANAAAAGVLYGIFSVVSFGIQAAGLALASVGFALPRVFLEKTESVPVTIALVPTSARSPLGVSLVATF